MSSNFIIGLYLGDNIGGYILGDINGKKQYDVKLNLIGKFEPYYFPEGYVLTSIQNQNKLKCLLYNPSTNLFKVKEYPSVCNFNNMLPHFEKHKYQLTGHTISEPKERDNKCNNIIDNKNDKITSFMEETEKSFLDDHEQYILDLPLPKNKGGTIKHDLYINKKNNVDFDMFMLLMILIIVISLTVVILNIKLNLANYNNLSTNSLMFSDVLSPKNNALAPI
jgi:hypothetical protein